MLRKPFFLWPFILGGILSIAWKVGAQSPLLKEINPNFVLLPLLLGVLISAITGALRLIDWYRHLPPVAVEVFLVDDRCRLYMYRHPLHQVKIPPGGRVGRLETIYDAVERTLRDRVGLMPDDYELINISSASQASTGANLGAVKLRACPFRVQTEHHTQRTGKKVHLDYLFVAAIKPGKKVRVQPAYEPADFFDVGQVEELLKNKETYPDVLDAYRAILPLVSKTR